MCFRSGLYLVANVRNVQQGNTKEPYQVHQPVSQTAAEDRRIIRILVSVNVQQGNTKEPYQVHQPVSQTAAEDRRIIRILVSVN